MSSTPTPTSTPIDFSTTPLSPSYNHTFARILDSAFTPSECLSLRALAASTSEGWQPAGMMAGAATETVHSEFRNSDRILRIDEETAGWVYERLRPLVEEIWEIGPGERWAGVTGKVGRKQGVRWRLVRVNPRLSFLRYGPGHYFKPHCDGLVELEPVDGDGAQKKQKSFVTLHLYLNGDGDLEDARGGNSHEPLRDSDNGTVHTQSVENNNEGDHPLQGGATRFWTPNKKEFLDVHPKAGRVLMFQQRMLVHSGEAVVKGVKYTMRSDFMFEQVDS